MDLQIRNLRKTFNNQEIIALNNINLDIPIGTSFGVLGRNGAGKTTIIRILLQIYKKDSGQVLYNGKDIFKENIKIGYLPEERGLYLKNTVKDQLIYFGKLKGLTSKESKVSIMKWLNRLGIQEYYKRPVQELSKGNMQKVQLITSLLNEPEILILDEPFSGLDPVNVELFKSVFKELLQKKITIIFSSHRIDDVEEFCNNVVLLNKGNIVDYGEIEDIKSKYGKKILNLKTNKCIDSILEKNNLKFVKEDKGYRVTLENDYNIGSLIEKLVKANIFIENINVNLISLNQIFLDRLS